MMPTVYIETTVPSYYHETRRSPMAAAWRAATRRWWDECRQGYQLFTSPYVFAEFGLAPRGKGSRIIALLNDVPLADEPPGLRTRRLTTSSTA